MAEDRSHNCGVLAGVSGLLLCSCDTQPEPRQEAASKCCTYIYLRHKKKKLKVWMSPPPQVIIPTVIPIDTSPLNSVKVLRSATFVELLPKASEEP